MLSLIVMIEFQENIHRSKIDSTKRATLFFDVLKTSTYEGKEDRFNKMSCTQWILQIQRELLSNDFHDNGIVVVSRIPKESYIFINV